MTTRPPGRQCAYAVAMAAARSVLGRHVVDRVVDQHRVELPSEPNRPHVADRVGGLWIQPAGHGEHRLRQIDQGQREAVRQVTGQVPAARSELEHLGPIGGGRRLQQRRRERRLLRVLLRRRDQRPPVGQFAVEAVLGGWTAHARVRSYMPWTYAACPRCMLASSNTLISRTASSHGRIPALVDDPLPTRRRSAPSDRPRLPRAPRRGSRRATRRRRAPDRPRRRSSRSPRRPARTGSANRSRHRGQTWSTPARPAT